MRQILNLTRLVVQTCARWTHGIEIAAGTGLLTLAAASSGLAQSMPQYPVSAATMSMGDTPVSSGVRNPIVDASFRHTQDQTSVKPASYVTDFTEQCYQEYCQAEEACGPTGQGCNRCDITWYTSFEGLWLQRTGDKRFSLTNNFSFNDEFDFQFGGRYTAGRMLDCVNAYEFVYTGLYEWSRFRDVQGNDNIDSPFQVFDTQVPQAVPPLTDTVFDSADRQQQTWNAEMQSFEFNRRLWAWDAVSTLIGFRYLNYEEDYALVALRTLPAPAASSAAYTDNIDNDLFGGQIGGDLFYVTSLKTSVSMKGKLGLFGNISSRDLTIYVNDAVTSRTGADETDLAGMLELGVYGHYQCTRSFRISGGYELWYISEVATVPNQRPERFVLDEAGNLLFSGRGIRNNDEVLLHGFTAGLQLLY